MLGINPNATKILCSAGVYPPPLIVGDEPQRYGFWEKEVTLKFINYNSQFTIKISMFSVRDYFRGGDSFLKALTGDAY